MAARISWQTILGQIIKEDEQKKRIANELGINPRTLDRWVDGSNRPKNQEMLRMLSQAVPPHYQKSLIEALEHAFPDVNILSRPSIPMGVPHETYRRILRAYTQTPEHIRQWTIINLIFLQLLSQIDPDEIGTCIVLVRCVFSSSSRGSVSHKTVRGFVAEEEGVGTNLWQTRQIAAPYYFGLESSLGRALAACKPVFHQSIIPPTLPPFFFQPDAITIRSMAMQPILCGGRLAGGILVGSTQEDFFTPTRKSLLEDYSHLCALGFKDEEFSSLILLNQFPPAELQHAILMLCQQKISQVAQQAALQNSTLDLQQIEQAVSEELQELFSRAQREKEHHDRR